MIPLSVAARFQGHRFCTWCLVFSVASCSGITDQGRDTATLALTFSAGTTADAAVDAPFVSVLDSVGLIVAPTNGTPPMNFGRHILRGEKAFPFSVQVKRGTLRFSALVLSNNGTSLFTGDTTVKIDSDDFSLVLNMKPLGPLMVIAPDTASTFLDDGKLDLARVAVHNRAIDTLAWRVSALPSAFGSCSGLCGANPDSGRLGPGQQQTLTFFTPNTFPAQTLCYSLTSNEGDATVCWKKD